MGHWLRPHLLLGYVGDSEWYGMFQKKTFQEGQPSVACQCKVVFSPFSLERTSCGSKIKTTGPQSLWSIQTVTGARQGFSANLAVVGGKGVGETMGETVAKSEAAAKKCPISALTFDFDLMKGNPTLHLRKSDSSSSQEMPISS